MTLFRCKGIFFLLRIGKLCNFGGQDFNQAFQKSRLMSKTTGGDPFVPGILIGSPSRGGLHIKSQIGSGHISKKMSPDSSICSAF